MDSSGTLELQLEAIKVGGKRVRVAVGAMKDWVFLVKIIIGSRCIVHGNGLFGFGDFLFLFVLSKTMDYSPWVERKNRAKTLRHGTGWEGTRREMKQREREIRNRERRHKT